MNPWQDRHPSVAHFEQVFTYDHLPEGKMREVSAACSRLAEFMLDTLPDNQELAAGLRSLWEAKNCFVLLATGKFEHEGRRT